MANAGGKAVSPVRLVGEYGDDRAGPSDMRQPGPDARRETMRADRLKRMLRGLPVALLAVGALAMGAKFLIQTQTPATERNGAPSTRQHILPGVTLVDAQPAGSGLVVTSIRSSSAAARQDILVGDGIVAIDGTPVHSLDQASRYLIDNPQRTVVVALVRDDQMRWVTLDRSGF